MPNFIGSFYAPYALEERRAQQESAVLRRIVGHAGELPETPLARCRLAFLQPLLVGDRLLLHVLDIERTAYALIFVQISAAQQLCKVPRLMDSGVEAQPADP